MVEIVWNPLISETHKTEIEKYLKPYLFLVPKWCQKLTISLYTSEGDANIQTGINYEYRNAYMQFFSGWLLEQDSKKQMDVVHDLYHITTSVYVDWAENTIKTLCPDNEAEKFNKVLLEESRMRCESMTQDLAFTIMKNNSIPPVENLSFTEEN